MGKRGKGYGSEDHFIRWRLERGAQLDGAILKTLDQRPGARLEWLYPTGARGERGPNVSYRLHAFVSTAAQHGAADDRERLARSARVHAATLNDKRDETFAREFVEFRGREEVVLAGNSTSRSSSGFRVPRSAKVLTAKDYDAASDIYPVGLHPLPWTQRRVPMRLSERSLQSRALGTTLLAAVGEQHERRVAPWR
jgi:hypothetical protein